MSGVDLKNTLNRFSLMCLKTGTDKVKIGVDQLKTLLSDQGTQNGIFPKETQNIYIFLRSQLF